MRPQNRSPVLVLILSIVTCGIYYFYWIYTASLEIGNANSEPESMSPGLELVLCIITCGIYSFFWYYKYSQKLNKIAADNNIQAPDNTVLYIVLLIFTGGTVSATIMQSQMNTIFDRLYPPTMPTA